VPEYWVADLRKVISDELLVTCLNIIDFLHAYVSFEFSFLGIRTLFLHTERFEM